MDRRRFVKNTTALGLAMAPAQAVQAQTSGAKTFWPGGARLVVSLSMQSHAVCPLLWSSWMTSLLEHQVEALNSSMVESGICKRLSSI